MDFINKILIPILCISISIWIFRKFLIRKEELKENDTLEKEKLHDIRVFYFFWIFIFLLPIGFSYAPHPFREHWGIVCAFADLFFFIIFVYPKLRKDEENKKLNHK